MKISLRKAHALQQIIQEYINDVVLNTTININEFQINSIESVISDAKIALYNNVDDIVNLNNTICRIRQSVARANAAQINDILARIAAIDKILYLYEGIYRTPKQLDSFVIRGKLGRIAASDNPTISTVTTSVIDAENLSVIGDAIIDYKRKKSKLKDQLLDLNIQTMIELCDSDEDLLINLNLM